MSSHRAGVSSVRAPLLASTLLPLVLAGCSAEWKAEDVDGDGFTVADGDCWDQIAGPDGSELSGADFSPAAQETWYDGYDTDCDGAYDFDADGDGWVPDGYLGANTYGVTTPGDLQEGDCWDDPDGLPLEGGAPVDGATVAAADTFPGASDSWYDGVDQDCRGDSDFDQDLDGFDSSADPRADGSVGEDCDDLQATISPEATEVCDDIDNDCDGAIDGDDDSVDPDSVRTWYADADDDTYGADDDIVESCDQPDGYTTRGGDCADDDAGRNPGVDELCNDIDDDCNGAIDEAAADAPDWFADLDGDSYGDPDDYVVACDNPGDRVGNDADCDDTDAAISPDADELCATAGVDDDCDGVTDEDDAADTETFYRDDDGDLYGTSDDTAAACSAPVGYVDDATDCNDGDFDINPGADEQCATVGVDDDCDGDVDEDDAVDATTFYVDADGDSYGDASGSTTACAAPDGYVDNTGDCDDSCDACWTDADEVCNDYVDNDCDGTANECAVDTELDLSTADLRLEGEADGDDLGLWTSVGDVDGDGQDDLLAGARKADGTGRAYLVHGPLTETIGGADADVVYAGGGSNDAFGRALALGDLDGDGYDDAVVSAPSEGGKDKGAVYVFYGPAADVSLAAGDAEWTIAGKDDFEYLGVAMATLGDIDDDGTEDVGIGSVLSDYERKNSGTLFILSSGGTGSGGHSENQADIFISGDDNDDGMSSGFAGPGDVDGDGVDDLVVGAWKDDGAATDAGAAFLFLGPVSGSLTAVDADATWLGEANADWAGDHVGALGDVDGDGLGDVLVGAYGQGSDDAGAAYVLLASTLTSGGSLADADAVFVGDAEEQLGTSGAGVGDIDMDGVDDFAIGNGQRGNCGASSPAGDAYLFYSTPSGSLSLADADAVLSGAAAGDCAAADLRSGGDLSGDGYPDILVGAPGGSTGLGAAILVEGVGM